MTACSVVLSCVAADMRWWLVVRVVIVDLHTDGRR